MKNVQLNLVVFLKISAKFHFNFLLNLSLVSEFVLDCNKQTIRSDMV